MRVSDVCQPVFVPTARPSLSPCGRYICTGFEDKSVSTLNFLIRCRLFLIIEMIMLIIAICS